MIRKLLLLVIAVGALGCTPVLAPTVECPEALREREPYCFLSDPVVRDRER